MAPPQQLQDSTIRTKSPNESSTILDKVGESNSASGSQTSKNSTTRLDLFPFFSKLPPELRLDIWGKAARAEPRVVEMDPWNRGDIRRKISTPALFHVSYEAREAAERVYNVQKSRKGFETVPQILINYDIDIPLIDYRIMSNRCTSRLTKVGLEMFGKMRRIAIQQSEWGYFLHDFSNGRFDAFHSNWDPNMWKSLEEVIILAPRKNVKRENEYGNRQSIYATTWIKPAAMEQWWDEATEGLAGLRSGHRATHGLYLWLNTWSSAHLLVQQAWEGYFARTGQPRNIKVSRGIIFTGLTGRNDTLRAKVGFTRGDDTPNEKRDEDWVNSHR